MKRKLEEEYHHIYLDSVYHYYTCCSICTFWEIYPKLQGASIYVLSYNMNTQK